MTVSARREFESEGDLREIYRQPSSGAEQKNIGHIDAHCRRFIELSAFLCMGTMGPDGLGDVTPRGGERGFVHVIDERTLAMPDRPGNNRLDSLTNLVSNPGVGLLFFVAGFEDLLRVNGRARISSDSALMDRFVVDGRPPRSVVIVDVVEVYLHCPKAIRRAGLWRPETWVDRSDYPTAGQIYRDQLSLNRDVAAIDAALDRDARENLY